MGFGIPDLGELTRHMETTMHQMNEMNEGVKQLVKVLTEIRDILNENPVDGEPWTTNDN